MKAVIIAIFVPKYTLLLKNLTHTAMYISAITKRNKISLKYNDKEIENAIINKRKKCGSAYFILSLFVKCLKST